MNAQRHLRLADMLLAGLLILLLVAVHTHHFEGRTYRQDEAWVVHYALVNSAQSGLLAHTLGIFTQLTPENFVQDLWVMAFGHVEPVVRFLSTLLTALSLALVYRLAADLYDRRAALWTVALLGSLSLFAYFVHEARPYAALSAGTAGVMLFTLRFARRPNRTNGLLAFVAAGLTLYLHPFIIFVLIAQTLFLLIFLRLDRGLLLKAAGLLAAVALLALPRLILNFTSRGGRIGYALDTSWDSLEVLYDWIMFQPEALGVLLLGVGLIMPIRRIFPDRPSAHMRGGQNWRRWYPLVMLVLMLALTFTVNAYTNSLTPRNLIILTPALALIAAYGLSSFPWQAQIISLLLVLAPFVMRFQPLMGNAGYERIAAAVDEFYDRTEGRVAIIAGQFWEHIPVVYFLQERIDQPLANADIFHISGAYDMAFTPDPPLHMVQSAEPEDLARFTDYMAGYQQLVVVDGVQWPDSQPYMDWIDANFVSYRTRQIAAESYYRTHTVTDYRRIPEVLDPIYQMGDVMTLRSWRLHDAVEVTACQMITIETWWQADDVIAADYSLTLALAGPDGSGITNADGAPAGLITGLWEPDRLYVDERALTVPCDAPSGELLLLVGLYDVNSGQSVDLSQPDGAPLGPRGYLTTLFVGG